MTTAKGENHFGFPGGNGAMAAIMSEKDLMDREEPFAGPSFVIKTRCQDI